MLDVAPRTTHVGRKCGPDERQSGVPLALVHRARREDAFVTGWRRVGPDDFFVSGRWPSAHPFFPPVAGGYDPLLVAETMRQAGILVVHAGYSVPMGYQFMLSDFRYTSVPELLRVDRGTGEVEVQVSCSEVARRGPRPMSIGLAMTVRRGGHVVAEGRIRAKFVSPGVYARLRGDHATPRSWISDAAPVMPLLVGRSRVEDVLIAPTAEPGRWLLRVDTSHPTLFQGRKDHVPGMLLLEAARQTARTLRVPDSRLAACADIAFHRYAEFDSPCLLQAELLPTGDAVRISGQQDGESVFTTVFAGHPACNLPSAWGSA